MRRLIGIALVLVLAAPSLAVCAGAAAAAKSPATHACCPKEDGAAVRTPSAAASLDIACCKMSDEAAARTAAQIIDVDLPSAPTAPVSSWLAPVLATATHPIVAAHAQSPHVPRHVLLSVFRI